ncbi:MAG: hypothetical protein QNJ19_14190 [Woeseiaceae bacterium]|nr:hypothetical protein [Woeseiaceae bacterium]
MTAAETLEIALLLREEAQRSFEYWLTISFAFIAATFLGRRLLKPGVSVAFGALYVLTVTLLIARYVVSGISADRYLALAIEQGAEPFVDSTIVTYLRVLVFAAGTLSALWFLYINSKDRER